jgi:hypothetical protein
MGLSASKLSKTKSGVVNANFFLGLVVFFNLSALPGDLCAAFFFIPYFFASLLRFFLFLLHHHHRHFSASNRGFLACATAAQNVSSTQGSCRCPVARSIFSYIRCGFCLANSDILRIPSNSKSRNIAGPIDTNFPSCRPSVRAFFFGSSVLALIENLLDFGFAVRYPQLV